jgi:D-serine deaminase-like pyridoxal phosphate-dependent protein
MKPMSFSDRIQRPTLALDEAVCRNNIAFMRDRALSDGVRFRPHMKTAQSRTVAQWFHQAGIDALTVSSVGMARYFAQDGWKDITIAFPFNPREINTVNALPADLHLGLLVESVDVVDMLARGLRRPVDLWLKVDTGHGRTGIAHDDDRTLQAVIQRSRDVGHLQLRGLLTHAGMTYGAKDAAEIRSLFDLSRIRLVNAAARHSSGERLLCSAGDTPGCTLAEHFDGLDEIRPGNMTFYDVMQLRLGVCTAANIAVAMFCPVVALHPRRGEALIHGGAVHFSRDGITGESGTAMYGLVCLPRETGWSHPIPGAWLDRLSQEHGTLRLPDDMLHSLHPGDLLAVLPVHSCLTAHEMRGYMTTKGERIDHYSAQPPDLP